jgi:pimeloyl-ACP methyl ester carboxylesterase
MKQMTKRTTKRTTKRGLSVARGGRGDPLLVLLHGLGANASVWSRMVPLIEASWQGRWIAPDLRGHGRSLQEPPYGFGMHAADIAGLIASEHAADVTLVGHSFGGVVAALVATGWFGPRPREVAAFGVKIDWSADEIAKMRDMAQRSVQTFATRDEAIERYLKVSGLIGLVEPSSPDASLGVAGSQGEYRVAMDPRVYGAVGPSIEGLLRLAHPPLRLAAGGKDPMVTLEQMRRIDPAARLFDGVGHNAHWEAPDQVWSFIAGSR